MFNSWLEALPTYPMARNLNRKKKLKEEKRDIYDFGVGDPQEPTDPLIIKSLQENIDPVSQYPEFTGSLLLRKTCSDWAQKRLNVSIDPVTQILSTNGSKEAVFHISQVLLNNLSSRKGIVAPEPCYPVHRSGPLLAGAELLSPALDPKEKYILAPHLIPKEWIPRIRAMWVCYPHNPTGATLTKQQALDLYNWALKHDIVLLSDEAYIDSYDPGTETPFSFLEISQDNQYKNILSFFTLSKRSGMTGYRTGFIAGDQKLIEMYGRYRTHAGLSTPDFIQKAAVTAWTNEAHVLQRNEIFAQKRKLIHTFLEKHNFEFIKTNCTLYVWIKVPQKYSSSEEYAAFLAQNTGIIITPGDVLGDPKTCQDWFRLALVPSIENTQKALSLWEKFT
jgi:succinyldiaminopimelate transaminase